MEVTVSVFVNALLMSMMWYLSGSGIRSVDSEWGYIEVIGECRFSYFLTSFEKFIKAKFHKGFDDTGLSTVIFSIPLSSSIRLLAT